MILSQCYYLVSIYYLNDVKIINATMSPVNLLVLVLLTLKRLEILKILLWVFILVEIHNRLLYTLEHIKHILCNLSNEDSNTDHRRWLERCLLMRGDHLKKCHCLQLQYTWKNLPKSTGCFSPCRFLE